MASPYDDAFAAAVSSVAGTAEQPAESPYAAAWREVQRRQMEHQPSRAPVAPFVEYNPTDGMSALDKIRAGVGKSMVDTARGAGQWLGLVSRDDVAESRKRDKALEQTGAGQFGQFLGGAAVFAPTALIPSANTITGAALLGGLSGALQPSTSNSETASNVGLGAAVSGAVPLGVRAMSVGKGMVEPLYQGGRDQIIGRALRNAAGSDADTVATNLVNWKQLVPGSTPTVAEAAQSPGIAALQRASTAINPNVVNVVSARQAANNEARIALLRDIIGDKEASKAAREAATNALYAMANGQKVTITPELEALLQRPIMRAATNEAKTLAENEGRQFSLVKPTPPQPSAMLGPDGRPAFTVPGQPGSMLGRDAHTLKMAIDDVIEGAAGQPGLARNARRAAAGTQSEFLTNLEAQLPAYGQARSTFAQMSAPINQSEAAQAILDRALASNVQGNLTPAAFNRALSDRTVQSALQRKGATLDNTFTPEQLAKLNAVKADLTALDFANNAGRGVGSDTVQKLAYTNLLDKAGMWNWMSGMAPMSVAGNVAKRVGQAVYKDANEQLAEQLAMTMLSPQMAAELMKKAGKKGLTGLLGDAADRSATAIGAGASSLPALRGLLEFDAAQ